MLYYSQRKLWTPALKINLIDKIQQLLLNLIKLHNSLSRNSLFLLKFDVWKINASILFAILFLFSYHFHNFIENCKKIHLKSCLVFIILINAKSCISSLSSAIAIIRTLSSPLLIKLWIIGVKGVMYKSATSNYRSRWGEKSLWLLVA